MIRRAREALTRPTTDPSFDKDEERSETPSADLVAGTVKPRARSAPPRQSPTSQERIDRAGVPDLPIPEAPEPRPPQPRTLSRRPPRVRRPTVPQPTDLIADAESIIDRGGRRGRGALSTLVQIIIAGVLALIVLGIFAGDEVDTEESPVVPVVPVTDIASGTCFNETGTLALNDINAVDCSEPHRFETIGTVVLAAGEYPGAEAGAEAAFGVCRGAFERYVLADYSTSIWYLDAIPPSQSRWETGDRVAHCYVFQLSGEEPILVTGSARGDGR
jgi:hypothetical protein